MEGRPALFSSAAEGILRHRCREPKRVRIIDATHEVSTVSEDIWQAVAPFLGK